MLFLIYSIKFCYSFDDHINKFANKKSRGIKQISYCVLINNLQYKFPYTNAAKCDSIWH